MPNKIRRRVAPASPSKRYEFHIFSGHKRGKPFVFQSLSAFDAFFDRVRPHLSNWAVWSDDRECAQYVGFVQTITPDQLAALAKELGNPPP